MINIHALNVHVYTLYYVLAVYNIEHILKVNDSIFKNTDSEIYICLLVHVVIALACAMIL